MGRRRRGAARLRLLAQGAGRRLRPLDGDRGRRSSGLDFDATVAWPAYDWMGVAKAALESTPATWPASSAPRQIRVNLVAAGPIRTMAAKSIPGFARVRGRLADRAPLGWDINDTRARGPGLRGPAVRLVPGHHRRDGPRRRRLPRHRRLSRRRRASTPRPSARAHGVGATNASSAVSGSRLGGDRPRRAAGGRPGGSRRAPGRPRPSALVPVSDGLHGLTLDPIEVRRAAGGWRRRRSSGCRRPVERLTSRAAPGARCPASWRRGCRSGCYRVRPAAGREAGAPRTQSSIRRTMSRFAKCQRRLTSIGPVDASLTLSRRLRRDRNRTPRTSQRVCVDSAGRQGGLTVSELDRGGTSAAAGSDGRRPAARPGGRRARLSRPSTCGRPSKGARRSRLRILPEPVLGSSGTKLIERGILYEARCSRACAITPSARASPPAPPPRRRGPPRPTPRWARRTPPPRRSSGSSSSAASISAG